MTLQLVVLFWRRLGDLLATGTMLLCSTFKARRTKATLPFAFVSFPFLSFGHPLGYARIVRVLQPVPQSR